MKKKLFAAKWGKKSVEAALNGAEKQTEGQRLLLRNAEDQLAASKKQVITLKKKLEETEKAKDLALKARVDAKKAKEVARVIER